MAKASKSSKVPKRASRRVQPTKHRVPLDNGDRGDADIARLSLEVHQDVKKQLVGLMKPMGATSITEVIRRCTKIVEAMVLVTETGGKVYFEQNGQFERVVIL